MLPWDLSSIFKSSNTVQLGSVRVDSSLKSFWFYILNLVIISHCKASWAQTLSTTRKIIETKKHSKMSLTFHKLNSLKHSPVTARLALGREVWEQSTRGYQRRRFQQQLLPPLVTVGLREQIGPHQYPEVA